MPRNSRRTNDADEEIENAPPNGTNGVRDENEDLPYDPNQDVEVKRQLRRDYRNLLGDGEVASCMNYACCLTNLLSRTLTGWRFNGNGAVDAESAAVGHYVH